MKKNSQIKVIVAGKHFVASYDYLKSELPELSLEMVEFKDFIKKAEKAQIIIPAMAKVGSRFGWR